MLQAGPPYELDPYTLETKAGGPSSLNGWVQAGKAPSTTGSFILDKVRPRFDERALGLEEGGPRA